MAWEGSHAPKAYEQAEKNLRRKPRKWLAEAYAEWKCYDIDRESAEFSEVFDDLLTQVNIEGIFLDSALTIPESMTSDPFTDGRYKAIILETDNETKDRIADYVWQRASEQRTCDNGGYTPWMCPHGCHKVEW